MSTLTTRAAYLRGVLVGVCSAAVSVAVHGAAGGGLPSDGSLVMMVLGCGVVGAAASAISVVGWPHVISLLAALYLGQFIGHLSLATMADHLHGGFFPPHMLLAHSGAALVCALLIGLTEHLYRVCASVLCWLTVFAVSRVRPGGAVLRRYASPVVPQSAMLSSGQGTRGPPAVAVLSA